MFLRKQPDDSDSATGDAPVDEATERDEAAESESALAQDYGDIRRRLEQLEAELASYRGLEQRVSPFLTAVDHANRIREEARREAELTLRKARAEAEARMAELEGERRAAERELLRLRSLADEMRTRLSAFLATTLEQLQGEVEGDLAAAETELTGALEGALADAMGNEPPPTSVIAKLRTDGESQPAGDA